MILPQPSFGADVPCAVCDDPDDGRENQILFCDGCDLAVHQDCYGVPIVPSGEWHCKRCELSPRREVVRPARPFWLCTSARETHPELTNPPVFTLILSQNCVLCLRSLGAFKKTDGGEWVHVLCAEFVPGLMYEDEQLREPVIGTEKAVKERAKLVSPACPPSYLVSQLLLLLSRYRIVDLVIDRDYLADEVRCLHGEGRRSDPVRR